MSLTEDYGRSPAMEILPFIKEENRKDAYALKHWDEPGVQEEFYARKRLTWCIMGLVE